MTGKTHTILIKKVNDKTSDHKCLPVSIKRLYSIDRLPNGYEEVFCLNGFCVYNSDRQLKDQYIAIKRYNHE